LARFTRRERLRSRITRPTTTGATCCQYCHARHSDRSCAPPCAHPCPRHHRPPNRPAPLPRIKLINLVSHTRSAPPQPPDNNGLLVCDTDAAHPVHAVGYWLRFMSFLMRPATPLTRSRPPGALRTGCPRRLR
jgi:hypothetical protein